MSTVHLLNVTESAVKHTESLLNIVNNYDENSEVQLLEGLYVSISYFFFLFKLIYEYISKSFSILT